MSILDNYEAADQAFRTKAVLSQDNETLLEHLHGLSNQNNINTGTQHRDVIRGLTINNVLLQRHINSLQEHITALDAKNSVTQKWVVILAVAALISTGIQTIASVVQTYIAVKTYQPEKSLPQSTASAPPQPAAQSAAPTLSAPPSSGQAKSK